MEDKYIGAMRARRESKNMNAYDHKRTQLRDWSIMGHEFSRAAQNRAPRTRHKARLVLAFALCWLGGAVALLALDMALRAFLLP